MANLEQIQKTMREEAEKAAALNMEKYGQVPAATFTSPEQLNSAIPQSLARLQKLQQGLADMGARNPALRNNHYEDAVRNSLQKEIESTTGWITKVDNALLKNDPTALGLSARIKDFAGILDTPARNGIADFRITLSPTPLSREEALRGLLPTPEGQPQPQINPGPSQEGQPLLPPAVNPQFTGPRTLPFNPTLPQQPIAQQPAVGPQAPQPLISGNTSIPTVRREIDPSVDPKGDRALIEREAVRQQDQSQFIAQQQAQAQLQAINQYQQGLSGVRPTVEQEAQRQNQQVRALGQEIGTQQKQGLNDLGSLLNQRQSDLFQRAAPQLAEQAQTAGLLQSTGFGDALARQYKDLTADTQFQLGQQGLADRDLQTQLLQQGLSQQQQLQTGGLNLDVGAQQDVASKLFGADQQRNQDVGTILGQKQQLQLSGLQRQFSTQDLAESARLAQQYGLQVAPQSSSGGNVFGSLLGGAGQGAAIGGAIGGPMGAGIGAAAGGLGGLISGKKGK